MMAANRRPIFRVNPRALRRSIYWGRVRAMWWAQLIRWGSDRHARALAAAAVNQMRGR
jgi:hypothetical protein